MKQLGLARQARTRAYNLLEYEVIGLKSLCIAYFLYRWLKRFQGTSTDGRSCLIGQIPAKRFLHKSHRVISLRACFPTLTA
jgi:hypothetical protein